MATVLQDAKTLANRLVIRLCNRMAEQDKLGETIYRTCILFLFIGAGFSFMIQLEKLRPQVFRDYDISFEINMPAVEKRKEVGLTQQQRPARPMPARIRPPRATAKTPNPVPTQVAEASVQTRSPQPAPTASPAPMITAPDAAIAAPLPPQAEAKTSAPSTGSNAGGGNDIPVAPLQGDLNAVAGGDFGAQKLLAVSAPAPRLGNIKPYKQDLLARIAKGWKPRKGSDRIVLSLTISKEGQLLAHEIVESSGSSRVDREALEAMETVEFAPLPDWYKGDHLTWKLNLATIVHNES